VAAPPPTTRNPALFLAAVLLSLQALVAVSFGVIEVAQIRTFRMVVGAGVAVLMFGYGALLAAVARGVILVRRWSRGPAVATQILHLPIAWSFRDGATWWVALILAAMSMTVLVCLLIPPSTALFVDDAEASR